MDKIVMRMFQRSINQGLSYLTTCGCVLKQSYRGSFNHILSAKLKNFNFQPLEVVSLYRDSQHLQILMFKHSFRPQ